MIPYAIQAGDIKQCHIDLLEKVKAMVAGMPDHYSCHDVCAAVAIPNLLHRRGHFFIHGVEHSWLEIKDDKPGPAILIDAYPIAVASGPILLTTNGILNPHRFLYRGNQDY